MEERQESFDLCIRESRRSVRWVSGAIKFGFRVDAEGRISELRPLSSTIGHREAVSVPRNTLFVKNLSFVDGKYRWGGPHTFVLRRITT